MRAKRKYTKPANGAPKKRDIKFNIEDLKTAVIDADQDLMRQILQTGIDPNKICSDDSSLINIAAWQGDIDIIRLLQEYGANVNQANLDETPLFTAIRTNNIGLVKYLLVSGANPNFINSQRQTALTLAIHMQNPEMVHLLINAGAIEYRDGQSVFALAAYLNNIDILKILSNHTSRFDINKTDLQGYTALQNAASRGNLEAVEILIESNAIARLRGLHNLSASTLNNMQIMNHDGIIEQKQRFSKAAQQSKLSIDKLPNKEEYEEFASQFYYNSTDLNAAKQREQLSDRLLIHQILMEVELQEYFNIFEAIFYSRTERVKELVLQTKNLFITNTEGETPLTFAILYNKLDEAKLLLEHGANPNLENKKQISPLIQAIKVGNLEAVNLLLEHGANPKQLTSFAKSPLVIAVSEAQTSIAKEILKYETFNDKDLDYLLSLANFAEDHKLTEIVDLLDQEYLKISFAETSPHISSHAR
jgi:ankyrin repeat protein